jgi:hypothetical protein
MISNESLLVNLAGADSVMQSIGEAVSIESWNICYHILQWIIQVMLVAHRFVVAVRSKWCLYVISSTSSYLR